MAELFVIPQGSTSAKVRRTPLSRSLRAQTVRSWCLAHDPQMQPHLDDIVMHLPEEVKLQVDSCEAILRVFAENPEAVALYADRAVGDLRHARPAWSPTRVQSEPGSTLPLALRASWPQFDVLADPWELERRLADSDASVLHLPWVLTSHPDAPATATGPQPNDPRFESGKRPGTRQRCPSRRGQSSVSVVIPSAGFCLTGSAKPMLARCLQTIDRLEPPPAEVIVVVGEEFQGDLPQTPAGESGVPVRIVNRGAGPFDFSRAINCGLLESSSDLVLMLNDDIEAETTDWLGRMAAHLEDPTVGAVGAALLYPDGKVQHAGIVIDDARPLHPFVGQAIADTAPHGGDVARDTIAVTGACLLARRADLVAVGGLSAEFPISFGDIDLCLRLRRSGLRVVVEPAAVLIHNEGASREKQIESWEWDRFIHRWGEVIDPWYHPAYWRPDDPVALNRNVDHLAPVDRCGRWPARTAAVTSRVHRSRLDAFTDADSGVDG